MASYVQGSGFAGGLSYLNTTDRIRATHTDLTRSLLTVGYLSQHHARHHLGRWRATQLYALAQGFLTPTLKMSAYHNNLEQSESTTVSFQLGQAFTHWYAQQYLHVPILLHVQDLRSYGLLPSALPFSIKTGVAINPNGSRPDFIGIASNNQYHVLESKGRKRKQSSKDVAKALGQVSKINSVNGVTAITRCATFLVCKTSGIQGYVYDPPAMDEAVEVAFEDFEAIRKYYSFFMHALVIYDRLLPSDDEIFSLEAFGGKGFLGVKIAENVYFGIDRGVMEILTRPSGREPFRDMKEQLMQLLMERKGMYMEISSQNVSVGLDGIILIDLTR